MFLWQGGDFIGFDMGVYGLQPLDMVHSRLAVRDVRFCAFEV